MDSTVRLHRGAQREVQVRVVRERPLDWARSGERARSATFRQSPTNSGPSSGITPSCDVQSGFVPSWASGDCGGRRRSSRRRASTRAGCILEPRSMVTLPRRRRPRRHTTLDTRLRTLRQIAPSLRAPASASAVARRPWPRPHPSSQSSPKRRSRGPRPSPIARRRRLLAGALPDRSQTDHR